MHLCYIRRRHWLCQVLLWLLMSVHISRGIDLTGKWKEVPSKRTGLAEYLYGLGQLNILRRLYVTSVSFENFQTIFQQGNSFKINGFSGPRSEVYGYSIKADNSTFAVVHLGEYGGLLHGVSMVDDNDSLVTYLTRDKKDGDVEIISARTRGKGSRIMTHDLKHVPSGAVTRSYYIKQG